MKTVHCSNCETLLNLPPDFGGGAIQCPNCNKRFRAKAAGSAAASGNPKNSKKYRTQKKSPPDLATADELFNDDILEQLTAEESATAPQSVPTPPPAPSQPVATTVTVEHEDQSSASAADPSPEQAIQDNKANPTKLSFGFNSFWTPAIIKGSWWCVVVLSVLWCLMLVVMYLGAWLTGESMTSSISGMLPQGLDLQQVMSGNADPDALNALVDKLGSGNATPQLSTFQKVSGAMFGFLSFVSMLASLVLSVLWCRVFFETIVAVFDIAERLKSIDEKT